jgi:hypothetical protein
MSRFDELYDVVMEANAYNKYANKLQDAFNKDPYDDKVTDDWEDFWHETNKLMRVGGSPSAHNPIYNRKGNPDDREHARLGKKAWMKNHGDVGRSPENRYRRGRYFDEQKRIDSSNKNDPYRIRLRFKAPDVRDIKDRLEENRKSLNGTKESVDDIKLEIYESCRYGEISEEERDLLLEMI